MKYILAFLSFLSLNLLADNSNFDMKWSKVPSSYIEGAILGNGEQGTMIWARPEESLHFDVGDTRIYDDQGRLPIGKFVLQTKGKRTAFNMSLSMTKGEAHGLVKTAKGSVKFSALTVSGKNLNLVKFTVLGDEDIKINLFSIPAITTAKLRNEIKAVTGKPTHTILDYSNPKYADAIKQTINKLKPKAEINRAINAIQSRLVPLKQGKAYSLTWEFKKVAEQQYLLAWRTDYTRENLKAAEQQKWAEENVKKLQKSLQKPYAHYFAINAKWWNAYFQRSNISLPDKKLEAYYKWQLYKVAAATHQGKLPIDLMGPWFRATNWPKIWANLNVQLTYLPMAVANQKEIGDTLFAFIDNNPHLFIEAAKNHKADSATHARAISPYTPGGFSWEYGNFLWTLHNYWHFLRVYPDDKRMVEKFYPMLKRGANFVLHNCREDENGVLHTPKDISPEYEMNRIFPKVEDTTYNLEFLRWALRTIIFIEENQNLQDPQISKYKSALEKLAPVLLEDESGIMIGQGVKLEKAHRHYSHLVGLYPIKQMNLNDPDKYKLAQKAVDYWINLPIINNWSYKGYSRTGAASMYSMLGQGDKAYEQMQILLDTYGSANTMYIESGPVIETPISAAASIHEMLFQCSSQDWKVDELKFFTGVPSKWADVTFQNLKAEGGYTLSASRRDGKLTAVKIEASREGELIVHGVPSLKSSVQGDLTADSKGQIRIKTKAGEVLSFGEQRSFSKAVKGPDGKDGFHFGLN
ncbi:hypothetical protein PQO01_11395 [Lentisphaera marina]|uniref:glycosyl hydrolase family 95 catalytic domain-containing protein n=1 Tax=Lentisphaera marina TaxID=1111041 RepID=UPI002366903E|nr:hypothetical protein [Lentisphaera marina]MDD7985552.1 hypothetical protein [Lentisphaera marina]